MILTLVLTLTGTSAAVSAADEVQTAVSAAGEVQAAEGTGAAVFSSPETAAPVPLVLSDGYYRIVSALDSSKVFDIDGGSMDDGGNVQLYHSNGSDAQTFYVKSLGDGLYTLQNLKSGKVLDVANGSTENDANLQQYASNGSAAQQFYISVSSRDGYASISGSNSQLCIDVANASTEDRTNIRMHFANDSPAQQWKFESVRTDAGISDGYYRIGTALASSMVLDISGGSKENGGNLQLYDSNGTAAQVFYVKNLGSGLYEMMACNSGLLIDLQDGTAVPRNNIDQYGRNGSDAQKWYIRQSAASGFCTIASDVDSGMVLDIAGGSSDAGTNIQLYPSNDTPAQQWSFTSVDQPQVPVTDGLYTIGMYGTQGQVLDIQGGSIYNGGNLQLYSSNGTNAQKFYIISRGDGYCQIISANSQLALDVADGSSADGANVQQYASNGSAAQSWKITGCPGRYSIQSALGKTMDVSGGSTADGTNIQIYTPNGTDAQSFRLQGTELNSTASADVPADGGIYMISTVLDTSKVISVPNGDYAEGLVMEINTDHNADYQKFRLQRTSDGYYIIMNVQTGLVLTAKAYGGSTWGAYSGVTVLQYNEIEGDYYKNFQKWKLVNLGDGSWNLVSCSGYYLDVSGGLTDNYTKLDAYDGNGTGAQKFRFSQTSTSASIRTHSYATAPDGKTYWLEGTFWTDPTVSDADFLAAAIYCEGGNQGLAGEMMIGYSMLNRTDLSMMRYVIYQYGQYEICRDRQLTIILQAIHDGNTSGYSNLEECRSAAQKCVNGEGITLEDSAWVYSTDNTCVELKAGAVISRSDFTIYDGFMTPAAFAKHGFTPFGHHVVHYKEHLYYAESEIWS